MIYTIFRRKERVVMLLIVDLILSKCATFFALWLHANRNHIIFDLKYLGEFYYWFIFLSLMWIIAALINSFYKPTRIFDFVRALPALLGTHAIVVFVYLGFFFFFAPDIVLPRGIVLYQVTGSLLLIGIWRILYASQARRPGFGRKVLIIGSGWAGKTIAKAILRYAPYEFELVGFVDDNESLVGTNIEVGLGQNIERNESFNEKVSEGFTIPVLSKSSDLRNLVLTRHVPEVILAVSEQISTTLFQSILDCKELGIQISLMPVIYEQLTGRVPIEHIGDNWNVALPLDSSDAGGIYTLSNRAFDIILSLIGLAILLPIFPIIALVIYLESPGPIIYQQNRVGKGGKLFSLYKFRTMIHNAEKSGAERAKTNDPRITRIGKYLRKTRLDEMPQIINILKGDMSVVGPRPERPEHLEELDEMIPFHRLRNAVKPGMAGWAAINYGYIESLEDARIRLQYDLYYVKHQSLWLDFVIFLRMILQVLTLKGR